ncbi:hypothetical protein ACTGZQ_04095 [Streptococcus suis]
MSQKSINANQIRGISASYEDMSASISDATSSVGDGSSALLEALIRPGRLEYFHGYR